MILLNSQVNLYDLFLPAINFVSDWLTMEIVFGTYSFPLWAIFAFVLLVGIFARVISSLAHINFDF